MCELVATNNNAGETHGADHQLCRSLHSSLDSLILSDWSTSTTRYSFAHNRGGSRRCGWGRVEWMRLGRGAVGASRVERLRREDRGAENAEKVGYREGVSPSPPWGRDRFSSSKWRVLVHSVTDLAGTDKTYFWSAWRLVFLASSRPGGGAIAALAPSVDPPLSVVMLEHRHRQTRLADMVFVV